MHKQPAAKSSHRPKALTVFATAFVAGAVAAVGVNRALDIHLAQAKPQIECEPIFVALRSLPQGTPVTIWDVALRDWPKAMLPTSALRAQDRFEGMILRHPVREGQPLLSLQLAKAEDPKAHALVAETYVPATITPAPSLMRDADLWTPTAPEATADSPPAPQATPPQPAATPPAQPSEAVAIAIPDPQPTQDLPAVTGSPTDTASEAETAAVTTAEPAGEVVATATDLPSNDAAPSTSAAAASPAAEADAATVPKRYLVVPERIAMQAEASFTSPAAPPATAETVAVTDSPVSGSADTRPEKAAAAAAPARPQAAEAPRKATAGQARRQQPPTSPRGAAPARKSGSVPRVAQAPTLETHPNTEPAQRATVLDSWFPNLRAGFDATRKK
jgi:pilus assembly protein CpaB